MAGFREAIVGAAREAACQVVTPAGNAARLFSEIVEEVPVVGGVLALPSGTFSNAASLLCDSPPTPGQLDDGVLPTEGQCPVPYRVTIRGTFAYDDGTVLPPETNTAQLLGPIGPLDIETTINSQGRPQTSVLATSADGSTTVGINGGNGSQSVDIELYERVRVDGELDNCGDPDAPLIPLPPSDRTPTIPVDPGDGVLIDVDFRVNSPEININGDINIPISVRGPNFNFDLSLDLGGNEVNFNFGGGGSGDGCCPEDDIEGDGERRILGVVIDGLLVRLNRYLDQVPDTQSPKVYVPYVGLVRFTRTVDGRTVYSEDIRVKTSPQDVPCPWTGGATGFVTDFRTGASFNALPYYAKVKAQPSLENA